MELSHNIKQCYTCNIKFDSIYKKNVSKKVYDLSNIFKYFDKKILINMSEFLFNPCHNIIYECKSRNKPIHVDYDFDSDDENDYYYWNETKKICTNCFKKGLAKSLFETEKRLPYLRQHIIYFTNKYMSCQKEHLEKIDTYFLPVNYNIYYYRNKFPIKIKNFFSISMD